MGKDKLNLPGRNEIITNVDEKALRAGQPSDTLALLWMSKEDLKAIYHALAVRESRVQELRRIPEIEVTDKLHKGLKELVWATLKQIRDAEKRAADLIELNP